MVNKYKRKTPIKPPLDEKKLQDAIHKVRSGAISKRKAAKEIGVSEWTVRDRMKRHAPVQKEGAHTSLPYESERELQKMLEIKAKWGYAATRDEVSDLVQSYVNENKTKDTELGQYLQRYCKFKVRPIRLAIAT